MPTISGETTLSLSSEDAMTQFGRSIAAHLKPGDTLLLSGPIGAGKTHLVRAIIHALVGNDEEVPSPTYTLVQTYETPGATIWHADLYRLGDSSEVVELGLDEAMANDIVLIEWPDRLPEGSLPSNALEIVITLRGDIRELELKSRSERWKEPLRDFFNG